MKNKSEKEPKIKGERVVGGFLGVIFSADNEL